MAKQAIFAMFIEISFFLSFFFQLLEKRRQMCADEIKGKLVCHWKIYYLLGIYIYIWYEFGQTVAVTSSKSHKFVFQHDEEEDYY